MQFGYLQRGVSYAEAGAVLKRSGVIYDFPLLRTIVDYSVPP